MGDPSPQPLSQKTTVGCMKAVIELDWNFSPPNYFEEAIDIVRQDCVMTIADGKVHTEIDDAIYDAKPDISEGLHKALNDQFLAVQVLSHRAYKLSPPNVARKYSDGHRVFSVVLRSTLAVASAGTVDFKVTDKDGNVKVDSRRDRIEKRKSLASLITCHATDALLDSLLQSYTKAVHDPNDEFVYLYEIREALSGKFGSEAITRKALDISKAQWSRFGCLCNDEPLRQGRHRGKTGRALRDATDVELTEARDIARAMIEAYLRYLTAPTCP